MSTLRSTPRTGSGRLVAPVALLVCLQGCLAGQLASIGGITLMDAKTMSKVQELGDADLSADAGRLAGKSLRSGSPEYYAGLCLHEYIDGRYAEKTLATTTDPNQQSVLQGQVSGQYGSCASMCQSASGMQSAYQDLAVKYRPRCQQAVASQKSRRTMDALAKQVHVFETATGPLALFFAQRDCNTLLGQAQSESPNDARLTKLSTRIAALSAKHAAAIRKGKAFYNSPEARENFEKREEVNAERESIQQDIKEIQDRQEALNRSGSLDAYMQKRKLDDQIAAKRRLLAAKDAQLSRLKHQYTEMASRKGVL